LLLGAPQTKAAVVASNLNVTRACTATTAPWIQLISPNGGETYTAGQQITVKWTSCNASSASVLIGLRSSFNTSVNQEIATAGSSDGQETVTLPLVGGQGGYPLASGNYYKIGVSLGGNPNLADSSDNFFTINAPVLASVSKTNTTPTPTIIPTDLNPIPVSTCTKASAPSITLLSPNGGESYTPGQQITATWTSCNIPTTNMVAFNLLEPLINNNAAYGLNNLSGSFVSLNDGQETIIIPNDIGVIGWPYGKNYKIKIIATLQNPNNSSVEDSSDNLFIINRPTNTPSDIKTEMSVVSNPTASVSKANPSAQAISVASPQAVFNRIIRVGTKGEDVKVIQQILKDKGYLSTTAKVDGSYGPVTSAAVKQFQKVNGLGADGSVGPKTLEKINTSTITSTAVIPTGLTPIPVSTCTKNSEPSITLLSPNGGEVFTEGQHVRVTWTTNCIPASSLGSIILQVPSMSWSIGLIEQSVPNSGNAEVVLPSVATVPALAYGNLFKMSVGFPLYNTTFNGCLQGQNYSSTTGLPCNPSPTVGDFSDESNNLFTIN